MADSARPAPCKFGAAPGGSPSYFQGIAGADSRLSLTFHRTLRDRPCGCLGRCFSVRLAAIRSARVASFGGSVRRMKGAPGVLAMVVAGHGLGPAPVAEVRADGARRPSPTTSGRSLRSAARSAATGCQSSGKSILARLRARVQESPSVIVTVKRWIVEDASVLARVLPDGPATARLGVLPALFAAPPAVPALLAAAPRGQTRRPPEARRRRGDASIFFLSAASPRK